MSDALAVLSCLLGGVFFVGAWHVIIDRNTSGPDPESNREPELESEKELLRQAPWFMKLALVVAIILNPVAWEMRRRSSRVQRPGWLTASLLLILVGTIFVVAGLYIGLNLGAESDLG
jgi:NhaP-type Na+/H+ or K+/H+ antiporter